jgi:hypothetical protein
MDKDTCTVYIGQCFTVEWYFTQDGKSDVYDYFLKTTQKKKTNKLPKKEKDLALTLRKDYYYRINGDKDEDNDV